MGLVGLTLARDPVSYYARLDAARRRHERLALRSGLCDARAHLRRGRAPADHRADAGGWLRLDGELAGRPMRLLGPLGWQGTYLVYAALVSRFVAAPLHAFALPQHPRRHGGEARGRRVPAPAVHPANGTVFLLLLLAFTAYSFIPSGLSTHLLGDLPGAADRCRNRRADRLAVRAVTGGSAAVRIPVREERPSAPRRPVCRRVARRIVRNLFARSGFRCRPRSRSR